MNEKVGYGDDMELLRMTDPEPWPRVAARARDGAAEKVNEVKNELARIRAGKVINAAELTTLELKLADALLLLLAVGARIRPEGM
jgi:hypothetical protein